MSHTREYASLQKRMVEIDRESERIGAKAAKAMEMSDAQYNYLLSLRDQLLALWTKMGGQYAERDEQFIHSALQKRNITGRMKDEFELYTNGEAQRAIGVMKLWLENDRRTWNKIWMQEKADRERQRLEDDETVRTGFTFEQVHAWMVEHAPGQKWVNHFTWKKKIDGVSFYAQRAEPLNLYSEREARDFASLHEGVPFLEMFEPTGEIGWDGTLFIPRFTLEVRPC